MLFIGLYLKIVLLDIEKCEDFIGQTVKRLIKWLMRYSGVEVNRLRNRLLITDNGNLYVFVYRHTYQIITIFESINKIYPDKIRKMEVKLESARVLIKVIAYRSVYLTLLGVNTVRG